MKERLDVLLTKKGFFPSREKARTSIMAGLIYVDGCMIDKAGTKVAENLEISVKENICPYVSRGGLKLEKALAEFGLSLDGAVAMDIGASTGGFTDCMLKNDALKVYAVDVGYGQLDWMLRNDPRVINMEKTNIRYIDAEVVKDKIDVISIDVSFISLRLVLPVAEKLLSENGRIICLVKPQFEAGRGQVGKKGIVKDIKVHEEVINNVMSYGKYCGLNVQALTFSPVKGSKGNIEYLLLLSRMDEKDVDVSKIISDSHNELK